MNKKHPVLIAVLFAVTLFRAVTVVLGDTGKIEMDISRENENVLIYDESGWLEEDKGEAGTKEVMEGIDYFYDSTGIEPAVLIVYSDFENEGEIYSYVEEYYNENFTDEGHMVFLTALNEHTGEYDWLYIYNGSAAADVMSDHSQETLYDNFDYYWYRTSVDECTLYNKTLVDTADDMRCVSEKKQLAVLLILLVIVTVHSGYIVIKENKERKDREERARLDRIDREYDKATGGNL